VNERGAMRRLIFGYLLWAGTFTGAFCFTIVVCAGRKDVLSFGLGAVLMVGVFHYYALLLRSTIARARG